MRMEKLTQIIDEIRKREAREQFEAFGRIERIFWNGVEVKPWHHDSALVEIVREWERVRKLAISRLGGLCTLRVETSRRLLQRRCV